MAARSFERGWPIIFIDGHWVYEDYGKPITGKRACRHCEQKPTSKGYDACIGYVAGATSICCGHGVESPYTIRGLRNLNMQIEIDPSTLSDDERYHLTEGLEALENPSESCMKLLAELHRLSTESYNEFNRKHPGGWV